MSRGNCSLTLDIVKNTLWVDAKTYTTAEGALNADARFVAPVVDGSPEEPSSSSGPITRRFQTARAPRGSSAEYLDSFHQLRTCENGCESYEHQCGVQENQWREKRLSVDTWKIKRCWTDDDVTWRTQLTQPYQGPWRDLTHRQIPSAQPTKSHIFH